MIIAAILALSVVVLTLIVGVFGSGLPALGSDVVQMINMFIQIVSEGSGILWAFVHPQIVKTLLGLLVAAYAIEEGYKLVMWVAKKVPMLGVSD